jgi:hypothetical protein
MKDPENRREHLKSKRVLNKLSQMGTIKYKQHPDTEGELEGI